MTYQRESVGIIEGETTARAPAVEVIVDKSDPRCASAKALECDVFVDAGYFETPADYEARFGVYDPATAWLLAYSEGQLAGVCRVILPTSYGFMTINDARRGELVITPEGWATLSRHDQRIMIECCMAVRPEFRGRPFDPNSVVNQLFAAVVTYADEFARSQNPTEHGRAIVGIDHRYYRMVSRQFPGAFTPLGPMSNYLGSETLPAILDADTIRNNDKSYLLMRALGGLANNER